MFDLESSRNEINEGQDKPVAENKPSGDIRSKNDQALETPQYEEVDEEDGNDSVEPVSGDSPAETVQEPMEVLEQSEDEEGDNGGPENFGNTEGTGDLNETDGGDGIDTLYSDAGENEDMPLIPENNEGNETGPSPKPKELDDSGDETDADTLEGVEDNELPQEELKPLTEDDTEVEEPLFPELYEDDDGYKARRELTDEDISDNIENSLEYFDQDNWEKMDPDIKMRAMEKLRDGVCDDLGIKEKPEVEYYNGPATEYGCYNRDDNVVKININNIGDGKETADTVAHELRHAWQHDRAENPETPFDRALKQSFDDYVAEGDGYWDQLVESDARKYAADITGRM